MYRTTSSFNKDTLIFFLLKKKNKKYRLLFHCSSRHRAEPHCVPVQLTVLHRMIEMGGNEEGSFKSSTNFSIFISCRTQCSMGHGERVENVFHMILHAGSPKDGGFACAPSLLCPPSARPGSSALFPSVCGRSGGQKGLCLCPAQRQQQIHSATCWSSQPTSNSGSQSFLDNDTYTTLSLN